MWGLPRFAQIGVGQVRGEEEAAGAQQEPSEPGPMPPPGQSFSKADGGLAKSDSDSRKVGHPVGSSHGDCHFHGTILSFVLVELRVWRKPKKTGKRRWLASAFRCVYGTCVFLLWLADIVCLPFILLSPRSS